MPARRRPSEDGCCKRCVARDLLAKVQQAFASNEADDCIGCFALNKLRQAAEALVASEEGLGNDFPAVLLIQAAHSELKGGPDVSEAVSKVDQAIAMLEESSS